LSKTQKIGTLLKVLWVDSHAWAGWLSRDKWIEHLTDASCEIRSVGYIIYEDELYLSIAQSWGVTSAADILQIPKKCIIERKEMKV